MLLSSATMDSMRRVCQSVVCPLCGKSDTTFQTLVACGHHLCSKCVNKFVFNSNNKCPKCYAFINNSDVKDDTFINHLSKITSKLDQLVNNNIKFNNQTPQPLKSETKSIPNSALKCAPKTQKTLIIESLKACISNSSSKAKKSSDEDISCFQNSSKKNSNRPFGQSKTQIMIQLSGELDPNKESIPDSIPNSIPDSYEFTQNSLNVNKDENLMEKVDQIVEVLDSNSSNTNSNQMNVKKTDSKPLKKVISAKTESSKAIQCDFLNKNVKKAEKEIQVKQEVNSFGIQCVTKTSNAFTQTQQQSLNTNSEPTNGCHESNCCLHKNLAKIIELNICPTLNTVLSALLNNNNNSNKTIEGNSNIENAMKSTEICESTANLPQIEDKSKGVMTQLENFMEKSEDILASNEVKSSHSKQQKRQTNKQSISNKSKRSIAEPKTQTKKQKVDKSMVKPVVSETIPVLEVTPDLEVNQIEESINKSTKRKTSQTLSKRNSKRKIAEKRLLTDFSSSEDISEKRSSKKIESKKLNSEEKDSKLIVDNKDHISNINSEVVMTKRKPNQRKLESVSVESEDLDKQPIKTSTKGKRMPLKAMRSSSTSANIIPNKDKFKRPPSPTPSLTSNTSSSSSSRLRTSSTERLETKRFYILNSGLEDTQKKKLIIAEKELNAVFVNEWSDKVTHLVVGLVVDKDISKKERICQRNLKFMQALIANKWIVSFDWITDSLRSNRFVDEMNYEIKGLKNFKDSNAPNKSRTSAAKLFNERMVCFKGNFPKLRCDLKDLKQLVVMGGGRVVDSEKEFKRLESSSDFGKVKLICVTESLGLPNTQNNVKYISVNTFFDMVSNFETL